MKDFIKKNWFLVVIAVLLLAFVIYYAATQKTTTKVTKTAKQENGNYLVYASDSHSLTADSLYDSLYENYGTYTAYSQFAKAVTDAAVETTEELNSYASNYATYALAQNDEATILSALKQQGYDKITDLTNYYLIALKQSKLMSDYFTTNYDKYAPAYIKQVNPRKISHILVKVADVKSETDKDGKTTYTANMTEDEKTKLHNVEESLKTKTFAEVAKEYSDDGSASNGGLLGIYDDNTKTQFVKEFYEAAFAQELGKVGEPVLSQYGYHIILAEEPTKDELLADSTFMNNLMSNYQYASVKCIKQKADELGFKINNKDLSDLIDEYIKYDDEQLNPTTDTSETTESEGTK